MIMIENLYRWADLCPTVAGGSEEVSGVTGRLNATGSTQSRKREVRLVASHVEIQD